MTMPTHAPSLAVLIGGTLCGTVEQRQNGKLRFAYAERYAGPPLSLSMPVGGGPYGDRMVRPFMLGLLPDTPSQRRAIGREFGVRRDNPLRLLRHIGWDCPGAVQFCLPEELEDLRERSGQYVETSEEEIGERLAGLIRDDDAPWSGEAEHWSLGGAQSKIARARFGTTWYRCEGSAATTHIIKPGVVGFPHQALNEAVCLTLASLCGVPASRAFYQMFGTERAIVVERYDRIAVDDTVVRVHQEDCCQALCVDPEAKYPRDGGPGVRRILALLSEHANADRNRLAFTAELFFNYLIGGTDAHAKNYSILLTENEPEMAPLYDCASFLPYGDRDPTFYELPMAIGGERRFGWVGESRIRAYARAASLDENLCVGLMADLAFQVSESLDEAFDLMRGPHGEFSRDVDELKDSMGMGRRIRRVCESTLERIRT